MQETRVGFSYESEHITHDDIASLQDSEWNERILNITQSVSKLKEKAEKRRNDEIERMKAEAVKASLEKEKERERLEEIRKAEELEKASDKQKWDSFIQSLDITIPEMKSRKYRNMVELAKEKIEEIKSL